MRKKLPGNWLQILLTDTWQIYWPENGFNYNCSAWCGFNDVQVSEMSSLASCSVFITFQWLTTNKSTWNCQICGCHEFLHHCALTHLPCDPLLLCYCLNIAAHPVTTRLQIFLTEQFRWCQPINLQWKLLKAANSLHFTNKALTNKIVDLKWFNGECRRRRAGIGCKGGWIEGPEERMRGWDFRDERMRVEGWGIIGKGWRKESGMDEWRCTSMNRWRKDRKEPRESRFWVGELSLQVISLDWALNGSCIQTMKGKG